MTVTSVPVTVRIDWPGSALGWRSCRVMILSISTSGTTPTTVAYAEYATNAWPARPRIAGSLAPSPRIIASDHSRLWPGATRARWALERELPGMKLTMLKPSASSKSAMSLRTLSNIESAPRHRDGDDPARLLQLVGHEHTGGVAQPPELGRVAEVAGRQDVESLTGCDHVLGEEAGRIRGGKKRRVT